MGAIKQQRKEIDQDMSRLKVVTTAMFAVFVMSSLVVSSASATWLVAGSPLSGSAALATTAVVDETIKILVPSIQDLTLICSGAVLDEGGPRIEGTDKGFTSSERFLACNTTAPASGCALETANQTISINPTLQLAAKGTGEGNTITFTPETKSLFTEVKFNEANTCAFNGVEPVKGSLKMGAPTGQLELANQAIVGLGSSENNSLEVGPGTKVYLIGGKVLMKLQSGAAWSFK